MMTLYHRQLRSFGLLIFWTTVICIFLFHQAEASCLDISGLPKCCSGKQSNCYGYNAFGRKCFCDSSCTRTNDCCEDYRTLCHKPKIDCEVSAWSTWSACSKDCGTGIQYRTRFVVRRAQNGGRSCPVLKETQPCKGYRCYNRRVSRSYSRDLLMRTQRDEVALLLPVRGNVLNLIRRFDKRFDIRKKLMSIQDYLQNRTYVPEPDPYCAVYRIVSASSSCQYYTEMLRYNLNPWQRHGYLLQPTEDICVTCYAKYMNNQGRCIGSGLFYERTRWRAVGASDCHGRFQMINRPRKRCTCGNFPQSFAFL